MTFGTDSQRVHALAVESARAPLRERQILMVQQALHNAGVLTSEERREFMTACTGRRVVSLRDLRQGELRPLLDHLRGKTPIPAL